MSLDRLVLVLVCIALLLGGGFWLMMILFVSATVHPALALIPLSLAGLGLYILIRVIADRVGNRDDDHYDGMKH